MTRPINALIAGAHKAGTSSLKVWLSRHDRICSHPSREFTYFVNDEEYQRGYSEAYHRYFNHCPAGAGVLLAKSVGVMYLQEAAERAKAHNPGLVVVTILRDPVERAYSAFLYARRMGLEPEQDFAKAVRLGPDRFNGDWLRARTCDYLGRGEYAPAIKRLYQLFGREQVMVFLLRDLKENQKRVCSTIASQLNLTWDIEVDEWGVRNPARQALSTRLSRLLSLSRDELGYFGRIFPPAFYRRIKLFLRKLNRSGSAPPPMPRQVRAELAGYFDKPNQTLAKLIDRDLSHWGNESATVNE